MQNIENDLIKANKEFYPDLSEFSCLNNNLLPKGQALLETSIAPLAQLVSQNDLLKTKLDEESTKLNMILPKQKELASLQPVSFPSVDRGRAVNIKLQKYFEKCLQHEEKMMGKDAIDAETAANIILGANLDQSRPEIRSPLHLPRKQRQQHEQEVLMGELSSLFDLNTHINARIAELDRNQPIAYLSRKPQRLLPSLQPLNLTKSKQSIDSTSLKSPVRILEFANDLRTGRLSSSKLTNLATASQRPQNVDKQDADPMHLKLEGVSADIIVECDTPCMSHINSRLGKHAPHYSDIPKSSDMNLPDLISGSEQNLDLEVERRHRLLSNPLPLIMIGEQPDTYEVRSNRTKPSLSKLPFVPKKFISSRGPLYQSAVIGYSRDHDGKGEGTVESTEAVTMNTGSLNQPSRLRSQELVLNRVARSKGTQSLHKISKSSSVSISLNQRLKNQHDGENSQYSRPRQGLGTNFESPGMRSEDPSVILKDRASFCPEIIAKFALDKNWKPNVRTQLNSMVKLNLHKHFDLKLETNRNEQGEPTHLQVRLETKSPQNTSKSVSPEPSKS